MSESCSNNECGTMEKCEGCPSNAKGGMLKATHPKNRIRHVIGVVSGKGGVGKSSVTSLLACAARSRGLSVGILDADLTGPSIPKAFGLNEQAYGVEDGILPVETKTGIKVMSINLLLENPNQPVIWRGPILAGMVTQFWTDVIWGDLDYLFVDMPPGTGDIPLTIFQSLPLTGIVVVTAAQDLVAMIVEKAMSMAAQMNIPILGLIENMSYFICPNCHQKHEIFGPSKTQAIADAHGVPVLARLPLDASIAAACDEGAIEDADHQLLSEAFDIIMEKEI